MKEITETSNKGIQFLIQEEGLVKRPYLDQVGVPTIGIGCTYYENGTKVKITDPPISTERAIKLFRNLLRNYELAVYSNTRDDINHNQFDSLTSFTFNVGASGFRSSTLLKKVNENKEDPSIKLAFEAWKNAGGKPILLARRKREAELYFTPANTHQATDEQLYINQVKFIQSKLGLPDDGIFGKNTRATVIDFQTKHNLVPDGIAGPQTLAELNKI
ncbi:glycoside hydrolase family protein [Pedobacter gandavensis]|uniref:Lysozyme n=1 Tax=Pedobacter gandavensis TaxID=2679963 RepID=A0ABR6EU36_9SPHI|nr:peptidoglycan-binding protein [Pedobacter gandavensis]MBB2148780.1 glycoside hydrolase family protein [Pedobacter gandavensis]